MKRYVIALLLVALFGLSYANTPVEAAPPELENCEEAASVGTEALYACNVDGTFCVWDPSDVMRSGLLDCDW